MSDQNLPALRDAALAEKDNIPPNTMQYLKALKDRETALYQQNVHALGENEFFTIRDGDGRIRAVKKYVRLTAEDGGLILPIKNGPFVISAVGYTRVNAEAGVSVISQKTVQVGGKDMPNPYVETVATGRPKRVHVRKVAFGFSPLGQPKTCDRTIIYDAAAYRLVDLLAKARYNKDAFVLLPNEMGAPEEKGSWAKYPFDEAVSLWINLRHPEAIAWYSQLVTRERKIVDVAQTFAERNVSKAYHGFHTVPGQLSHDGKLKQQIPWWDIPVICWMSDDGMIRWDGRKYEMLQDRIEAITQGRDGGEFAPASDGAPHQIEVDAGAKPEYIGADAVPQQDNYEDDIPGADYWDEAPDMGYESAGPEDIQPPSETETQQQPPQEGENVTEPQKQEQDGEHIIKQAMALRPAMPEQFDETVTALGIDVEKMTVEEAKTLISEIGG